MSSRKGNDFSKPTAEKVAQRAGFLCSNPHCRCFTIGPAAQAPTKSTKIGEAAHICAAAKGGPRFDEFQTPEQRKDIENAIWLCANCADLIDKNNGVDYPASVLKKWKSDHESMMKDCIESRRRANIGFMLADPKDPQIAKGILDTLTSKGMMFMPMHQENMLHVSISVEELRKSLLADLKTLSPYSDMHEIVNGMLSACRYFMNVTSTNNDIGQIEISLGALRKALGFSIEKLARLYQVPIPQNLRNCLPEP